MSEIKFPLAKGLVTSQFEGDWLDALPLNMLAVPKPTPETSGYMRSIPGLTYDVDAAGLPRGGLYNVDTNSVFRVQGQSLQEIDSDGVISTVAPVGGSGHVPVTFSSNTTAFAANGKLQFWDGTEITELKNWEEGEKFTTVPNPIYTVGYGTATAAAGARIPQFDIFPGEVLTISFTAILYDNNTEQAIVSGVILTTVTKIVVDSGKFVLKVTGRPDVELGVAVVGKNDVIFEVSNDASAVVWRLRYLGHSSNGTTFENPLMGQMYDLKISKIGDSRVYISQITTDTGEPVPDTNILEDTGGFQQDGQLFLSADGGSNWVLRDPQPEPGISPPTDFDISNIIDVTRNRGRYVFIQKGKQTFGVTDIENEQRIDYIAPFYSAESFPDDAIAIKKWRDFVVVFGRYSAEFFSLTGSSEVIYQQNPAYTVQAGPLSTTAVAPYSDNFVILGGPRLEPPSVYLLGSGSYQEIASRRIQKYLRETPLDDLKKAYIEPIKYDAHDGFIIHLPDLVLMYNPAVQGAEWTEMRSDIAGERPYRGIYHIYHDGIGAWTVGDKRESILTRLDFSIGSHVGESVEYMLTTPIRRMRNARLFDFEVETVSGRTSAVERIALSETSDGITYSKESWIEYNKPVDFDGYVIKRNLGRVRNRVGYRLRWTTKNTTSIGDFRVKAR